MQIQPLDLGLKLSHSLACCLQKFFAHTDRAFQDPNELFQFTNLDFQALNLLTSQTRTLHDLHLQFSDPSLGPLLLFLQTANLGFQPLNLLTSQTRTLTNLHLQFSDPSLHPLSLFLQTPNFVFQPLNLLTSQTRTLPALPDLHLQFSDPSLGPLPLLLKLCLQTPNLRIQLLVSHPCRFCSFLLRLLQLTQFLAYFTF